MFHISILKGLPQPWWQTCLHQEGSLSAAAREQAQINTGLLWVLMVRYISLWTTVASGISAWLRTDLINQFSCLFNPRRLVIIQNTAGALWGQRQTKYEPPNTDECLFTQMKVWETCLTFWTWPDPSGTGRGWGTAVECAAWSCCRWAASPSAGGGKGTKRGEVMFRFLQMYIYNFQMRLLCQLHAPKWN